ncbi:cell adhesion molecule-related/down-regulated by oncogenes-like isoform X1 [Branchiostoma lanceolatum]|uniref:cell adhesion molecule-related/down-regulated by oncogenes-like isoform X1 n=1 Tax=Branchiostoma lanceolatum TaxID=7740 RepID=UPI003453696E
MAMGRATDDWVPHRWSLLTILLISALQIIAEESPPKFNVEPKTTTQEPGSKVKLRCSGSPRGAKLSWYYNGQPLSSHPVPGVFVRKTGKKLVIERFQRSKSDRHVGMYQCAVTSEAGSIISPPAYLHLAEIGKFKTDVPQKVKVLQGNTAIIPCVPPASKPAARVQYRHEGKWIRNSTERILITPSGNLQIANITLDDWGLYKCAAVNPVTLHQRVTNTSKVKIDEPRRKQPAQIVYPPSHKTITVQRGSEVLLECVASGYPTPSVTWRWDHGRLDRAKRVLDNLFLTDVQPVDAGIYTCSAENGKNARVKVNYILTVTDSSSITQGPEDTVTTAGLNVSLTCRTTGSPTPDVHWLHNIKPVVLDERHLQQDSDLVLHEIQPTDAGMYQCVASNTLNTVMAQAWLKVEVPKGFPTVETSPSDVAIEAGEVAVFACKISGSPAPDVQWEHNGKPVTADGEHIVVEDGTLSIIRVSRENEGHYKCVGRNSVGKSWVAASLTVLVPTTPMTLAVVKSGDFHHRRGQNIMERNMWLQKQVQGEKERGSQNSGSSAQVNGPRTPIGPSSQSVPEAPSKPRISRASDTSVYVSWVPRSNGGSPITAFKVQYKKITDGSKERWRTASDKIPPTTLSYQVKTLQPGQTYRFRVIAINGLGESRQSQQSSQYSVEGQVVKGHVSRPVVGPHITEILAVSPTTISVRWKYMAIDNVPIDGFYIYHRETDSDNEKDFVQSVVNGVGVRNFRLEGLQPEVMYDIKMQCFNRAGSSDYSNVMMKETLPITSLGTVPIPVHDGGDRGGPVDVNIYGGAPEKNSPVLSTRASSDMLYLILGVVLGVMVLVLIIFIAMCMWRAHHHPTKMDLEISKRQCMESYQKSMMDGDLGMYSGSVADSLAHPHPLNGLEYSHSLAKLEKDDTESNCPSQCASYKKCCVERDNGSICSVPPPRTFYQNNNRSQWSLPAESHCGLSVGEEEDNCDSLPRMTYKYPYYKPSYRHAGVSSRGHPEKEYRVRQHHAGKLHTHSSVESDI